MSDNKSVKYCIYCGTECDNGVAVCPSCNKSFTERENLFIEFLIDKTKDKYKGDLEDSIVEIIINFIKSHLYGVVLTISIVGVVVTSVVSNDSYIQKVTKLPSNEVVEMHNYTSDQNEIKKVVDDYFYYARNIDHKADAEEKLEKLMSEVITTEVMPGYPVTSTHDALAAVDADSSSYEYAIIDTDVEYATTIISAEFMAKGYRVAEVVLYETLKSGNEITKGLFMLTLIQDKGVWTVKESLYSYSDEKMEYYEEDYLYSMFNDIFGTYKNQNEVAEVRKRMDDCLMPDVANLEPNVEILLGEEYFYYCREVAMGVQVYTHLVKSLSDAGYRVAQGELLRYDANNNEEIGVITFVNVDSMWYVAEMVMGE